MKIKSKIIMSLLTLGLVSSVSATSTNVVYLTGSTAFRGTVYNALTDNAGDAGAVFDAGSVNAIALFGSTTASKCSYMVIYGTISNTPTIFDCAWSGSEAGIASASGISIQNIDNNGNNTPLAGSPETWVKADGSVTTSGAITNSPTTAQKEASSHAADLTQADTSQAVSLTPYVASTSTALMDLGTEGVVAFTWAKNYNSTTNSNWNDLKNVTLPQINKLLAAGYAYPAFFTGVASETNQYVYLIGRNEGSGTRANALVDFSYGPTTKHVQQYSIGEGVELAATGTLFLDYEGDNGYESGGGVAGALGIDGSLQQPDPEHPGKTGWMAIGYLSTSDAQTAPLTIAGNWLTLDGVAESDGAIEEGQYYFWGHEHLYGDELISGYQLADGQKLFNAVVGQLATSGSNPAANDAGISYSYMHATKSSDVAYPAHN